MMAGFAQRGAAAYRQTERETVEPRELERKVIAQVTADLVAYAKWRDRGEGTMPKDGHEALSRNLTLWSELSFDCMDENNLLPKELRAMIISLSLFVDRHTPDVIAGKKKCQPLIDLNQSIMDGLAGKRPAQG